MSQEQIASCGRSGIEGQDQIIGHQIPEFDEHLVPVRTAAVIGNPYRSLPAGAANGIEQPFQALGPLKRLYEDRNVSHREPCSPVFGLIPQHSIDTKGPIG